MSLFFYVYIEYHGSLGIRREVSASLQGLAQQVEAVFRLWQPAEPPALFRQIAPVFAKKDAIATPH
jgi:hypothetical protein